MSRFIDADETLKAMDTWDKFGVLPNGTVIPFRNCENADDYVPYVKYEDMVNCVKNMPTADVVEVVHGEWIDNGKECWDGSIYYFRQCDICGFERDDCNADYDTPYCPNCGAKMERRTE